MPQQTSGLDGQKIQHPTVQAEKLLAAGGGGGVRGRKCGRKENTWHN